MKTEHGYALGNLATAIMAPIVAITFFELKEENTHWFIYPIALAPSRLAFALLVGEWW